MLTFFKKFLWLLALLIGWNYAYANTPLILVYHDVVDEARLDKKDGFAVSTQNFAYQIQWLKNNGYEFINQDQLLAWAAGDLRLPEKTVLLTIDDALKSTCTHVLPFTTAFDIPVVIAVVDGWITQSSEENLGTHCSWEELRKYSKYSSVTFASHTHDMHKEIVSDKLGTTKPEVSSLAYTQGGFETKASYRKRLISDLMYSKKTLETQLDSKPVKCIVWPYGRHNGIADSAARSAGFNCFYGLNDTPTNLTKLTFKRILVTQEMGASPYLFAASVDPIKYGVKEPEIIIDLKLPKDITSKGIDAILNRASNLKITGVMIHQSQALLPEASRLTWLLKTLKGVSSFLIEDMGDSISIDEASQNLLAERFYSMSCNDYAIAKYERASQNSEIYCPTHSSNRGGKPWLKRPPLNISTQYSSIVDLRDLNSCNETDILGDKIHQYRQEGFYNFLLPDSLFICQYVSNSLKKELYVKIKN